MYGKPIRLALICMMGLAQVACGDLVGWWTFDEGSGTTVLDSSGNGYNGTFQGDPEWVPGIRDGALELDGDDWIDFGNPAKLAITEAISICCWVKPGVLGAQHSFVGRSAAYSFKANATQLRFTTPGIRDHNGTRSPLVIGEWQHVAVTFKPNTGGGLIFYINGAETERLDSSAMNAGTGPFRIGSNQWNEYFTGQIDDVRVYDHILPVSEIKQLAFRPKAYGPSPADGAIGVSLPLLAWSPGSSAVYSRVYFGTTPELTEADLVGPQVAYVPFYVAQFAVLQPGTTYFWRIDGVESDGTTHTGDVWHFSAAPLTAYLPSPADGGKWVDPNADLSWTGGQGALKHDLYFSTDQGAVENRDEAARKLSGVYVLSYDPGTLAIDTTYFWAVDEITAGGVKHAGAVWRFTTIGPEAGAKGEYFTGMVPGGAPALTRIDRTIDFNWGNPGGPGDPIPVDQFSARWTADLEVAVEDTYTFTTNTDDGVRLWLNGVQIIDQWVDQAPTDARSAPIALKPGIYSLQMDYYENSGGAVARLYWQTPSLPRQIIPAGALQLPLRAKAIYPQNTDANIPQDAVLTWSAGEKAVKHHVYFGEDEAAVAAATTADTGIYRGTQTLEETTFDPGGLEWNKTYFWRIDEVNDAEARSPWTGMVWSFTTADFLVVDDFESYNDEEGTDTRIYETWIDGWITGNGSTVGNWDPPFAEQTIVHTGKQSMPMDYNNVNAPFYSEAYREWTTPQDWTVNGVSDLTLFIRGNTATFVETAPGQYTISSNTGDIWGTADNFRYVYKRLNGDGAISAKVISATNTSGWAKTGVMIRANLDPASSYAFMFPTPNGRRAFQNRPAVGISAVSAHSAVGAVTLPLWVKVERKGNQFTAYYSTDGSTWVQQPDTENTGADASPNPQTIGMGSSVYIGLAVTSNNAAAGFCLAEFSDVVTSGSISGDWKVVNVGPNPGNDPGPLYVTVEDSSNKTVTVTHPDPGATTLTAWTEWKIPANDLAGVNLARVKRLYLGVGDKSPDGTGRIYVDDIRVTRPEPTP